MYVCDASRAEPSGVSPVLAGLAASGRIFGSSSGVARGSLRYVSPVSWDGGECLVSESWTFSCRDAFASPTGVAGSGVLRRSALATFSVASVALLFSCSLRMPAYCLCCAASSLASIDCFCRSTFSGSGICLSRGGIFFLPLDGGFGTFGVLGGGCCSL